jgi:hypothetical protein
MDLEAATCEKSVILVREEIEEGKVDEEWRGSECHDEHWFSEKTIASAFMVGTMKCLEWGSKNELPTNFDAVFKVVVKEILILQLRFDDMKSEQKKVLIRMSVCQIIKEMSGWLEKDERVLEWGKMGITLDKLLGNAARFLVVKQGYVEVCAQVLSESIAEDAREAKQ